MNGTSWIFFLLALALLPVIVLNLKAYFSGPNQKWPYKPREPQTENEWDMYWRLVKALPDHVVLAQVAMSAIVDVKLVQNRYVWRNRIDRKVVDYVVCSRGGGVVAAIELDDKTHRQRSRRKADKVKNKAFADAGIKLIRWESRDKPEGGQIRREVLGEGLSLGAIMGLVGKAVRAQ